MLLAERALLRKKVAAIEKLVPGHAIHAGGRELALQIFRLLLGSQVEAPTGEGVDVLEDGVLFLPVDKILRGDGVAKGLDLRPDHDQLIGLGIGHGREQRGVHDRKYRRSGANAKRKRDDGSESEDRRFD